MVAESLLLHTVTALGVALWTAASVAIAGNGLAWLHLVWVRLRHPPQRPADAGAAELDVLVQLPLYNEESAVAGLLRAVADLDWPRERLHVQVLDDSTDDTPARVAALLPELCAAGLRIDHVRRGHREGFKAGALAFGLGRSDAPLVAILDADFRPAPDWLRRAVATLPPDRGLLQCRWSFLNAGASVLTRAQALHLDAHFALEQQARSAGSLLMGFNGTAGVWRRAAIESGGGWEGDTLTEDLDLAYRAQLAGQALTFADELDVPCELPESIAAVRAQQHRWIRGGAQVARKLIRRVWRSDLPAPRRLQGVAHLLASSVFMAVFVIASLHPLLPLALHAGPDWVGVALAPASVLLRFTLVSLAFGYGLVCVRREGGALRGLLRLARDLVPFLLLATAISAQNAWAAWLGWRGPTGTFLRTPKRGQRPVRAALPGSLGVEAALCVASLVGAGTAAAWGPWQSAPFLALQAVGFGALVTWSLAEWARAPAPSAR